MAPPPLSDETEELLAMMKEIENNWHANESDHFMEDLGIPNHIIGKDGKYEEDEYKDLFEEYMEEGDKDL